MECFWSDLFLNGQALEVSTETPLGNHGVAPMRLSAGWNLLETSEARRELPADRLSEADRFEAPAATWVFRFDREYHGQPTFEVEAPAGSILLHTRIG